MENYTILSEIGSGAYGTVWKGRSNKDGSLVAIKQMKRKYHSWQEAVSLKEVKSLVKMKAHPNIVKLHEVIRQNEELYFVFEYINSGNLFDFVQRRRNSGEFVSEAESRRLMFQILSGIAYVHASSYMHRDIKPENVLVTTDENGESCAKIADLGCAKSLLEKPPHTVYVGTRWYRAPEVLLHDEAYNAKSDMWGVGAMMAELLLLRPVFPGDSELNMLSVISSVVGVPTAMDWPAGYRLAEKAGFKFNLTSPQKASAAHANLQAIMPNQVSDDCIDLLVHLLTWDPQRRYSAAECLEHRWFASMAAPGLPPRIQRSSSKTVSGASFGGDSKLDFARKALQRASKGAADAPRPGSERRGSAHSSTRGATEAAFGDAFLEEVDVFANDLDLQAILGAPQKEAGHKEAPRSSSPSNRGDGHAKPGAKVGAKGAAKPASKQAAKPTGGSFSSGRPKSPPHSSGHASGHSAAHSTAKGLADAEREDYERQLEDNNLLDMLDGL